MNKLQNYLILIVMISVFFSGCASAPNESRKNNSDQDESTVQLSNLLLDIEGQVEIRKIGWKDYLPANFGTALHPGDTLKLSQGSQAAVFCGNESNWEQGWEIIDGDGKEHGVPCTSGRPPNPWPDVAALRAENETESLFVMHPRNTALTSAQPDLQFVFPKEMGDTPVKISILSDDGKERLPVESTQENMPWPQQWAPLISGHTYVIVIGEQSIGSETTTGRVFWLLDDQNINTVNSLEQKLKQNDLSQDAQHVLIADLYLEYELFAEAIQLLEPLINSSPSPAIQLRMGRLYLETGLADHADEMFDSAISASNESDLFPELAETYIGKALISQMNNDPESFNQFLEQARQICEEIGDSLIIQEINKIPQ